jgi:hypothetical protein
LILEPELLEDVGAGFGAEVGAGDPQSTFAGQSQVFAFWLKTKPAGQLFRRPFPFQQ